MQLAISCPYCNGLWQIDSRLAGKQVRCSRCTQVFAAPGQAPTPPTAEAPLASPPPAAAPPRQEVPVAELADSAGPAVMGLPADAPGGAEDPDRVGILPTARVLPPPVPRPEQGARTATRPRRPVRRRP